MNYITYFDINSILNQIYNWFFPIGFLILLTSIIVIEKGKIKSQRKIKELIIPSILSVFFILFSTIKNFNELYALQEINTKHSFSVVEGRVKKFRPGSKSDSFEVNGINFKYFYYEWSYIFKKIRAKGGPIREGMPVRITYCPYDNRLAIMDYGFLILKLEIIP